MLYVAITRAKKVLILNPQLDELLHYVHPPTLVPRSLTSFSSLTAVVQGSSRSSSSHAGREEGGPAEDNDGLDVGESLLNESTAGGRQRYQVMHVFSQYIEGENGYEFHDDLEPSSWPWQKTGMTLELSQHR